MRSGKFGVRSAADLQHLLPRRRRIRFHRRGPVTLYTSSVSITKGAAERQAVLPTGETIRFGVHGPVAAHYKLDPVDPLPLPVDYVVAATGG